MFLLGAVLLESGRAYRATHLQHHRTFPGKDDPEGYPADMSMLGAILDRSRAQEPFHVTKPGAIL